MTGFNGLAIPGPTNMPFQVRQAMDIPLEDHRAPDFPAFTLPLFEDLRRFSEQKLVVFLYSLVPEQVVGKRPFQIHYAQATESLHLPSANFLAFGWICVSDLALMW